MGTDSNSMPVVRIKKIYLENFRSVKNGEIVCECGRRFVEQGTEPDIVAIYGQNGSGKTSIIQAISIFQAAVTGWPLLGNYGDIVTVGKEYAFLRFTLDMQYEDGKIRELVYSLKIKDKRLTNSRITQNYFLDMIKHAANKTHMIFDECIQMSGDFYGKNIKKQEIINTSICDHGYPFGPASKRKFFVNEDNRNELLANKFSAERDGYSFVFEEKTISAFEKVGSEYIDTLKALVYFASRKVYVLDSSVYACITSTVPTMPLYTRKSTFANTNIDIFSSAYNMFGKDDTEKTDTYDNESVSHGLDIMADLSQLPNQLPVFFPLESQIHLYENDYSYLSKEIDSISVVFSKLFPGKEIFLKNTGTTKDERGNDMISAELSTRYNGIEMPLRYESAGTIKLVSMLNCLIMAYNDKSVTVAIDEFDSGIFEYLLGQIVQVFEESAVGQLFFTSHNLRPLELISKKSIYFTTADENNQYVHLKNIGQSNNLRSVYYREINLDESELKLYSGVEKEKLAIALGKAGMNG